MQLKDIINTIRDFSQQPHLQFERLVLKLFEKHLDELGKDFTTYPTFHDVKGGIDASAPSGINNDVPSIIEIKFIHSRSINTLLNTLLFFATKTRALHGKFNFLIVIGLELKKAERDKLETSIKSKFPDFHFEIWDVNNLAPLF